MMLEHVTRRPRRGSSTVLTEYERHYNHHRPHRAKDRRPPQPAPTAPGADLDTTELRRDEIPNGLINEYRPAA
jgi:hypothetical protein